MTPEPWMHFKLLEGRPLSPAKAGQWKSWWESHRDTLKLVRTAEEARLAWHPPAPPASPRQRWDRRTTRHIQAHWRRYLLGLTGLVALIVIAKLAKRGHSSR